jgi:hypothetical protein
MRARGPGCARMCAHSRLAVRDGVGLGGLWTSTRPRSPRGAAGRKLGVLGPRQGGLPACSESSPGPERGALPRPARTDVRAGRSTFLEAALSPSAAQCARGVPAACQWLRARGSSHSAAPRRRLGPLGAAEGCAGHWGAVHAAPAGFRPPALLSPFLPLGRSCNHWFFP